MMIVFLAYKKGKLTYAYFASKHSSRVSFNLSVIQKEEQFFSRYLSEEKKVVNSYPGL